MAFKLREFTVEAFNRDVNRSGDLLHKYHAWSGYRARVSELLGEAFALHPQTDCALVTAAGNANDIDLRFLCGKLQTLTLSDTDADAMRRGIERQCLSDDERGKLRLAQSDYTGAVQTGLFPALETLAGRQAPANEIAHHIRTSLAKLAALPVQAIEKPWPLVVSCPVYTQLLYTQIEVFLKLLFEAGLYSYEDLNIILNAAYGAMPGVLARYNAMLINACAPGGLIVLLSDMIEMETDGQAYRDAHKAAYDGALNARDADALIARHGSELAILGRRDFLSKTEMLERRYLLWPFDEIKEYLVSVCLAKRGIRGEAS